MPFIRLCIFITKTLIGSPHFLPSLALLGWALFWRARLSDEDWLRKEAVFPWIRVWALAPWAILIAITPAIAAQFEGKRFEPLTFYAAPALAFVLSFAPYFTWAIGRGRMPAGPRRTLGSRKTLCYLWACCAAAEIGLSLYADRAAEPFGPQAISLIFTIPVAWCWIVVVGILLHALAVRRTRREVLEDAAQVRR